MAPGALPPGSGHGERRFELVDGEQRPILIGLAGVEGGALGCVELARTAKNLLPGWGSRLQVLDGRLSDLGVPGVVPVDVERATPTPARASPQNVAVMIDRQEAVG